MSNKLTQKVFADNLQTFFRFLFKLNKRTWFGVAVVVRDSLRTTTLRQISSVFLLSTKYPT